MFPSLPSSLPLRPVCPFAIRFIRFFLPFLCLSLPAPMCMMIVRRCGLQPTKRARGSARATARWPAMSKNNVCLLCTSYAIDALLDGK